MDLKLSRRARALEESSTVAATQAARRLVAAGRDVIMATAGEPDGGPPPGAREALIARARASAFRYGPPQGLPEARAAIARWMTELYGREFAADRICLAPGAKFALYSIFFCLCDDGDDVLIPSPHWVSYADQARMAGATPRFLACGPESGYKLSAETLAKALRPSTRALVLCSPGNPTGSVYSADELRAIASVVEARPDLWVVCDDIYNQILFDDRAVRAPHLLDFLSAPAAERALAVHGASKSFGLTGWRLGWFAGPAELVEKAAQLQSQTITCVPDFLQLALIDALAAPPAFVSDLRKRVRARFVRLSAALSSARGLRVHPSEGAFYAWIRYDGARPSELVATELLERSGVAIVAGSAFGCEGHFRVSLTIDDSKIDELAARLARHFETESP